MIEQSGLLIRADDDSLYFVSLPALECPTSADHHRGCKLPADNQQGRNDDIQQLLNGCPLVFGVKNAILADPVTLDLLRNLGANTPPPHSSRAYLQTRVLARLKQNLSATGLGLRAGKTDMNVLRYALATRVSDIGSDANSKVIQANAIDDESATLRPDLLLRTADGTIYRIPHQSLEAEYQLAESPLASFFAEKIEIGDLLPMLDKCPPVYGVRNALLGDDAFKLTTQPSDGTWLRAGKTNLAIIQCLQQSTDTTLSVRSQAREPKRLDSVSSSADGN